MATVLITVPAVLASALFGNPAENTLENATTKKISVEFAVLLENENPITGTARCHVGHQCTLVKSENPELEFSIHATRTLETVEGQLSIDCGSTRCSFANGKRTKSLLNERRFDFYEGRDGGETPLVWVRRKPIGSIFLIYK